MKRASIALLFVVTLWSQALAQDNVELAQNKPIPHLLLQDLNKNWVDVIQQAHGKAAVIGFVLFANKSTKKIMSFYQSLLNNYPKDLKVFLVALDDDSAPILAAVPLCKDVTVLWDKGQQSVKPFQIIIVPTMVLVDSQGLLQGIYINNLDPKQQKGLSNDINVLLEKGESNP